MKYTIFDTPVLCRFMPLLSRMALVVAGWRVEGKKPDMDKYVVIAAPHTSNWDFPLTLLIAFALRLRVKVMAKDSLLKSPFGVFFKWFGVIPIDRSSSNNVVAQSIEKFNQRNRLALVVSPAGTRSRVSRWKTGFYHIANGADVPIVLGFLDYKRRAGGIREIVMPTGDLEMDMATIKGHYRGIQGKYPEKQLDFS